MRGILTLTPPSLPLDNRKREKHVSLFSHSNFKSHTNLLSLSNSSMTLSLFSSKAPSFVFCDSTMIYGKVQLRVNNPPKGQQCDPMIYKPRRCGQKWEQCFWASSRQWHWVPCPRELGCTHRAGRPVGWRTPANRQTPLVSTHYSDITQRQDSRSRRQTYCVKKDADHDEAAVGQVSQIVGTNIHFSRRSLAIEWNKETITYLREMEFRRK